jgi:hypothetical protein
VTKAADRSRRNQSFKITPRLNHPQIVSKSSQAQFLLCIAPSLLAGSLLPRLSDPLFPSPGSFLLHCLHHSFHHHLGCASPGQARYCQGSTWLLSSWFALHRHVQKHRDSDIISHCLFRFVICAFTCVRTLPSQILNIHFAFSSAGNAANYVCSLSLVVLLWRHVNPSTPSEAAEALQALKSIGEDWPHTSRLCAPSRGGYIPSVLFILVLSLTKFRSELWKIWTFTLLQIKFDGVLSAIFFKITVSSSWPTTGRFSMLKLVEIVVEVRDTLSID